MMIYETFDEHETPNQLFKRLESIGYLDPNCKSCQEIFYSEIFYSAYKIGMSIIFAPPHKPSDRCESGKRPHCTCDICF